MSSLAHLVESKTAVVVKKVAPLGMGIYVRECVRAGGRGGWEKGGVGENGEGDRICEDY